MHGLRYLARSLRDGVPQQYHVDLLVEFTLAVPPVSSSSLKMKLKLEPVLGRSVELRAYEDLSPSFRDQVAAIAQVNALWGLRSERG